MKITLKDGTVLEDVTAADAVTVLSKSVQKEVEPRESLQGKRAPIRPGARQFPYTISGVRRESGKTIVSCSNCDDKMRQAQIGKHYRKYHADIIPIRNLFPYTKVNSVDVMCDVCQKVFQQKSIYGHIKNEHPDWKKDQEDKEESISQF